MLSVPTGGSVRCECCNAAFHRLSSHLDWNARCAAFYNSSLPLDMGNGVLDDVHRLEVAYFKRKVMLLVHDENQEEILGVPQQLTNYLMTLPMTASLMKTLV